MTDQPNLPLEEPDESSDSLPTIPEQTVQEIARQVTQSSGGKLTEEEASNIARKALQMRVTRRVSQSGPLPRPEVMGGYEKILPGAAERIMAMAERQAAHRQELEREQVVNQVKLLSTREEKLWGNARLGIWLAFIICLVVVSVGAWLVASGNVIGGGVALGLSSLAAAFIYGSQGKRTPDAPRETSSET
ncbi:MAG: DUF2335 domain-containing protein [bacterium]|nr:DUF2335 domain-containing protein [bacterium]